MPTASFTTSTSLSLTEPPGLPPPTLDAHVEHELIAQCLNAARQTHTRAAENTGHTQHHAPGAQGHTHTHHRSSVAMSGEGLECT